MSQSENVKKRAVGRPKKNKAIQKLRVQTWFNAVSKVSGKSAYELEKEFAPSTVDREEFNKQRARLWEKYRLGKTMPTIKEKKGGRKGTAQLVEERYPGTLAVLQDPIWILADPNIQMEMDDLKVIYLTLEDETKSLLLEDGDLTRVKFWRKPTNDYSNLLAIITRKYNWHSLKVLFCLLREALICQNQEHFKQTLKLLQRMSRDREVAEHLRMLAKLVGINFADY